MISRYHWQRIASMAGVCDTPLRAAADADTRSMQRRCNTPRPYAAAAGTSAPTSACADQSPKASPSPRSRFHWSSSSASRSTSTLARTSSRYSLASRVPSKLPPTIDVVHVQAAADQADLGRGRARAGVRAAAHANPDPLVAIAALLQLADQVGQVALAFGHRQPAGGHGRAGHGVAPQCAQLGAADREAVLRQQRLDARADQRRRCSPARYSAARSAAARAAPPRRSRAGRACALRP